MPSNLMKTHLVISKFEADMEEYSTVIVRSDIMRVKLD
jgi:hypothetical protein